MKNPFKQLKNDIALAKKPQVKLKFTTCGEVLIDGLPFSFGVESVGLYSEKGIAVSLSGDVIERGELTFGDSVEMHMLNGTKIRTIKRKLEAVKKKDGKKIYRAKFPEAVIAQYVKRGIFDKKPDEEQFMQRLSGEISFKVYPCYKGEGEEEVMITVYPIENPLNGLAVNWKNCTSDRDWFAHNLRNGN